MSRNSQTCRSQCTFLVALFAAAAGLVAAVGVCAAAGQSQSPAAKNEKPLQLTSTSFDTDSAIPLKYACSGANISPALSWTEPPANTQSFALIVDDPDAPTSTPAVHWLIYAIPATQRTLAEDTAKKATLPGGARQGRNSAGKIGYTGPCPDPGKVHHYFFKLYALDYTPDLKPKAKAEDVQAAVRGHATAEAELIGRFQRE